MASTYRSAAAPQSVSAFSTGTASHGVRGAFRLRVQPTGGPTSGAAGAAALSSLTTPATAELAASSTGADLSSFALYELDLGARLAAESKTVAVGDMVRLVLGPNEQVGTTDMNMEVLAIALRTRHHFTFNDRTLRNLP